LIEMKNSSFGFVAAVLLASNVRAADIPIPEPPKDVPLICRPNRRIQLTPLTPWLCCDFNLP